MEADVRVMRGTTPLGDGADGPPQWRPRQSHLAQRPGRKKAKHADTAAPHTQNNTKHSRVSVSQPLTQSAAWNVVQQARREYVSRTGSHVSQTAWRRWYGDLLDGKARRRSAVDGWVSGGDPNVVEFVYFSFLFAVFFLERFVRVVVLDWCTGTRDVSSVMILTLRVRGSWVQFPVLLFSELSSAICVCLWPEECRIWILTGDYFRKCLRIPYVVWFDSGYMFIRQSRCPSTFPDIFHVKVDLGF